ncbi:hypothetical protein KO498_09940 [Lentibacter algarum]|uniref:DUF6691 family protein n=1 Tax=Lentibacter algarum TaxID=576131 RepID=UPI001C071181|nr:DUF6691 family protein [Lentibacter algarum]MBU2982132.1 hypothetical protein [Lentibacter algarum]
MRLLIALFAGALFGSGLFISGMTDTAKVTGWLDIFGNWDPTLAFVLGGAILPMFVAWRFTKGRAPLTAERFPTPSDAPVDRRLVIGSLMFGAGWGLSGLCPGPAMATLGYGGALHWLFFAAMLAGMLLAPMVQHRFFERDAD